MQHSVKAIKRCKPSWRVEEGVRAGLRDNSELFAQLVAIIIVVIFSLQQDSMNRYGALSSQHKILKVRIN